MGDIVGEVVGIGIVRPVTGFLGWTLNIGAGLSVFSLRINSRMLIGASSSSSWN